MKKIRTSTVMTIFVVLLLFLPVLVAELKIDDTHNPTRQYGAAPRVVFINATHGYAFYNDDSGQNATYKKTTDGGVSWPTRVEISNATLSTTLAVWYDQWTPGDSGDLIHLVLVESVLDDTWYVAFNTTDDSLVRNWTVAVADTGYRDGIDSTPSITKATDGTLYLTHCQSPDCEIYNSSNGTNWENTNLVGSGGTDPQSIDDSMLFPLSNSDLLYVSHDDSTDTLLSKTYNGSNETWDSAWLTVDDPFISSVSGDVSFSGSFYKTTNDVYIIGNYNTTKRNTNMRLYEFSNATRSWTTKPDIVESRFLKQGALVINQSNGDLYAVYVHADHDTEGYVKYKKSTDGGATWSGEGEKLNNGTGDDIDYIGTNFMHNGTLYAIWWDDAQNDIYGNYFAGTPVNDLYFENEHPIHDDIYFGSLVYGPSPNIAFINDSHGYVFYPDDAGDTIKYKTTVNGSKTWALNASLNSTDKNWQQVSVWYDQWTPGNSGDIIHVIAAETITDDIWYKRLNVTNGSLQPEDVWTEVLSGSTHSAGTSATPSITRSLDGTLYAYGCTDSNCQVLNSSDGVIWGDTGIVGSGGIDPDDADPGQLFPLSNDDILLVIQDGSADDLLSKVYNKTNQSWDNNWTDIDLSFDYHSTYDVSWGGSLYKGTNDVYVVGNNQITNAAGDIETYRYNDTLRNWTDLTPVQSDASMGAGTVSIDEFNGDLHAFYTNATPTVGSLVTVLYEKSTDGGVTWVNQQKTSFGIDDFKGLWTNYMSDEIMFISWADTDQLYLTGGIAEDLDHVPPSVNFTSPGNGTNFTTDNQTFNLTATDKDAGMESVIIRFSNGTNPFNLTATNSGDNYSVSVNVSTLVEDFHNVTIYANDTAGNVNNTEYIIITIDRTPPNVTSIQPAQLRNLSTESISFNATVVDAPLGVETVLFSFDNATGNVFNYTATNRSSNWNVTLNTSAVEEGSHVVTIYANDSVGNTNNTATINFTVDRTAPTVNFEIGDGVNTTNTTPTITFNFTDNIFATASCSIYVDDSLVETNSTTLNATTTNFTLTTLADGPHSYYINCTESSSNIGQSATQTITVDTTAPLVSTINSPLNESNLSSIIQAFNVTVTDETLPLSVVLFNITNTSGEIVVAASNVTPTEWNASVNISTLDEGVHIFSVIANDTVGNINISQTGNFTVDYTPPNITIDSPLEFSNLTQSTIDFNTTILDTLAGVENVIFQFSNLSTPFNRTATNTSGTWNVTLDSLSLQEGVHEFKVFANDTFGNQNSTSNISFTIDRTAPLVTIHNANNSNFSLGEHSFNATITDDITDVYNSYFTFTNGSQPFNRTASNKSGIWNVTVDVGTLQDGIYTVIFYANDSAGNVNGTKNISITIDHTSPTVVVNNPSNGSNFSSTTILFNITPDDNLIDINNVEFEFGNTTLFNRTGSNSSGYWNVSLDTSSVDEGIFDVSVYVNDSVGNRNTTNLTITVDRSAPAVTLLTPSNGSNVSSGSQLFNSTVRDNLLEVDTVLYRFSNGSFSFNRTATNTSGAWNVTLDLSVLMEGNHTVSVLANDSVGNLNGTENISIMVDRTAPIVNLETVNDTNTTDTTPTINFNFTDDLSTIGNCSVIVDDSIDITTNETSRNTSTSLTLSELANGVHRYSVNCTDVSGNSGVSTEHIITIDTISPNIVTVNTPSNGSNLSTGIQLFNVTVNDTQLTVFVVKNVVFEFTNNSQPFNVTPTQNDDYWTSSIDLARFAEENHTLTIHTNDTAGNANSSSLLSFTVDRTTPIVSLETTNDTLLGTNLINISFNVTDNLFNTTSCSLYFNDVLNSSNSSVKNNTHTNITLESMPNGEHEYYVNCTDDSSNVGQSDLYTVHVDTTAPGIVFNTPSNGSNVSTGVQDFNVSILSRFIDAVTFEFVNGSVPFNVTPRNESGYWNSTVNLSLFDEGRHVLVVHANDTNLRSNETNLSFTVDRTAPAVNLETANESTATTATPGLSFNFTDDLSTTASCTLYVNETSSGQNAAVINGTTTSITVNRTLVDGNYTWNVTCNDSAGNVGASTNHVLVVAVPEAEAAPDDAVGGGSSGGSGGHVIKPRTPDEEEEVIEEVECNANIHCPADEYCVENTCMKIFDLKTVEVTSPVDAGGMFDFTYFIKGMADISGDVTITFWIEKDGERVSEGSDVIFVGEFEEKTEEASLSIPSMTDAGVYRFYVGLEYDGYYIESYRTVEILVAAEGIDEEVVEEELDGPRNFAGQAIDAGGVGANSTVFLVVVGLMGGLVTSFVLVRRKKDVTDLETWVLHLQEQNVPEEDMYTALLMQHYWKKRDLKKVFSRIIATENLRERHNLIPQNVMKAKRFVVHSARTKRSKEEVVNVLQLQGLDTDVVTEFVKVHYR